MTEQKAVEARWLIHTPNLLKEILDGSGMAIYSIPVNVLGKLLGAVGDRAAELNDPILNDLMCQLTIYSVADPTSPDYDKLVLREIQTAAEQERKAEGE